MKYTSALCTALLFCGLVLLGCEAPTTALIDEAAPATLDSAAKQDGNKAQATGSGHFDDDRFPEPELRTFSFTAQEQNDGSATGQWQLNNRNFPIRIHGEVECLTVDGNEAWFAGLATQSDDDEQIGIIRGFRVIDNGEGNGSPPDQISAAIPVSSAQLWCDVRPEVEVFDIEKGNVQVH